MLLKNIIKGNKYDDYILEINLKRNKKEGVWENEKVKFWNNGEYGWQYSEKYTDKSNYGYDTLQDVVIGYLSGCAKVPLDKYQSVITYTKEYKRYGNFKNQEIYCKIVNRYFYNNSR